jgi:hypothetical protein
MSQLITERATLPADRCPKHCNIWKSTKSKNQEEVRSGLIVLCGADIGH